MLTAISGGRCGANACCSLDRPASIRAPHTMGADMHVLHHTRHRDKAGRTVSRHACAGQPVLLLAAPPGAPPGVARPRVFPTFSRVCVCVAHAMAAVPACCGVVGCHDGAAWQAGVSAAAAAAAASRGVRNVRAQQRARAHASTSQHSNGLRRAAPHSTRSTPTQCHPSQTSEDQQCSSPHHVVLSPSQSHAAPHTLLAPPPCLCE
jgi:hypothetical protein